MTRISSDDEFDRVRTAGAGYVYNDFAPNSPSGSQDNVLHEASCRELTRSNLNVAKELFEDLDEAVGWLTAYRGPEGRGWRRCRTCDPDDARASSGSAASNPALLLAWEANQDRGALAELQRRGALQGEPTNPAGRYARYLAICALGGHHATDSGHHVVTAEGIRLQVHGRHIRERMPTTFTLSKGPSADNYDMLLLAVFDSSYEQNEAWLVAREVAREYGRETDTGRRLMVSGKWREDSRIQMVDLVDPQGV